MQFNHKYSEETFVSTICINSRSEHLSNKLLSSLLSSIFRKSFFIPLNNFHWYGDITFPSEELQNFETRDH